MICTKQINVTKIYLRNGNAGVKSVGSSRSSILTSIDDEWDRPVLQSNQSPCINFLIMKYRVLSLALTLNIFSNQLPPSLFQDVTTGVTAATLMLLKHIWPDETSASLKCFGILGSLNDVAVGDPSKCPKSPPQQLSIIKTKSGVLPALNCPYYPLMMLVFGLRNGNLL